MKNWNKKDNYNSDIDYQKALKKKKLLKVINIISYILSGICIILLLVGCINSCTKKKEDNPQVNNVVERYQPLRVIADVEEEIITFEEDDFYNLQLVGGLIFGLSDEYYVVNASCDGINYTEFNVYMNQGHTIGYIQLLNDSSYVIEFQYELDVDVVLSLSNFIVDYDGDLQSGLNGDIVVGFGSGDFDTVYAIVDNFIGSSDIQYDEELFDALTDTVTNFIGTLSSGIGSVLALFWANNSLTVLGTLTVIVVGVALVYFLFRFIIGLTRLRG